MQHNSTFATIAADLEPNAARRLQLAYGGHELSIPSHIDARHYIALNVGLEAAQMLVAKWAGVRVYVPMGAVRDERDTRIRAARAAGDLIEEIAGRYGLTARSVLRILGER